MRHYSSDYESRFPKPGKPPERPSPRGQHEQWKAILLWFIFGSIGMYFYLGCMGRVRGYITFLVVSFILAFWLIGFVGFWVLTFVCLWDLFRIIAMTPAEFDRRYNEPKGGSM